VRSGKALLLAGLATVLVAGVARAGTREDLQRMEREIASLASRVQILEVQASDLKKGLADLKAAVEALERSAQTADLRADLSEIRRRLEALQARLESVEARPISPPTAIPVAGREIASGGCLPLRVAGCG
jgi:septal ring factor EnvC (AmiA/AmiB activator)